MSIEQACCYATFILHDQGLEITGDNIKSILDAAGISYKPFWPNLFAKHAAANDIAALIGGLTSASPAAGGAAPAAGDAGADGADAGADAGGDDGSDSSSFGGFDMFG